MKMGDIFQNLFNQFKDFIPNFLGAIAILIIGFIVSKLVAGVIKKMLVKIGIDKFGDKLNEIDFISKADFSIKISTVVSKFIYYFILIFFLIASADVLNMPAISNLVVDLFNFLPKLLVAFIFLIFGTLLSELIRALVDGTLSSLGVSSSKIISNFLFYFLFINVVILAIAQADINTEFLQQNISIIIAGGVLAFAIGYGLASKDVVSNFLSSQYTKDKVSIGDLISMDGVEGHVVDIDRTSITIANAEGKVIYPLKFLLNEKVSILNGNKRIES